MDRRKIGVGHKIGALLLLAPGAALAAPVFTGDVAVDFVAPEGVTFVDPGGLDVGVPLDFPPNTTSGNDMQEVRFEYDPGSDTLFVGFDTFVIAGDVDGDGDPGVTSPELAGLGGVDTPDFSGTESFALMIDVDEDGIVDVIAGVSATTDIAGYSVSTFVGTTFAPGVSFGVPIPLHTGSVFASPSASQPDLEFTITNFSLLPASSGSDSSDAFMINAFIGSFSDAGVGEDFVPGVDAFERVCMDFDGDGSTTCDNDCDDFDPDRFPGNTEICDGDDEDCDGAVDEGFDSDGNGVADCFDTEVCDGADNDGDGAVDEGFDGDGDGFTSCGGDCVDDDAAVFPGAGDDCDAVDNDCDGIIDEDAAGGGGSTSLLAGYQDDDGSFSVIGSQSGQASPLIAAGDPVTTGLIGITTTAISPADGLIYLATGEGDDSLYTVDTAAGALTLVGALTGGATNVQGMDFANAASAGLGFVPGGLYAISIDGVGGCNPNCLFTIDPATGEATMIGAVAVGQIRGLSFDPVTGALWAYDPGGKGLYIIDPDGTAHFQFRIPDSHFDSGTGVDTAFSLAHSCEGGLYSYDIAYGVLLWIDRVDEQAHWVGEFGDAASESGSFDGHALDNVPTAGDCGCPTAPAPAPTPAPTPMPTPAPTPVPDTPTAVPTPQQQEKGAPQMACDVQSGGVDPSAALALMLLSGAAVVVRRRQR